MDNETQDYRLDKMDRQLEGLEKKVDQLLELLTEFKIQKKDIERIFEQQEELKADMDRIKVEVSALKLMPEKKSAERWNYIVEYIFKGIVAVAIAAVLVKAGLK